MKNNMREHARIPLMIEQALNFNPGALRVKLMPAHRTKARIPLPLKRIEVFGRDGVVTAIIFAQNGAGLIV